MDAEVLSRGGSSAAELRDKADVYPSRGVELAQGCFNSEQRCRGQNPMDGGKLNMRCSLACRVSRGGVKAVGRSHQGSVVEL